MPEILSAHDAVVIGGGPAGCVAAILLARAGRDVLLLEKTRTAHDKVCGEFISWEAVHYLRILGMDLPGTGAQLIRQLRLFDRENMFESALPFPAWSLSRRLLDEALLKMARQEGVSVRRGESVNNLSRLNNNWVLNTTQDTSWHAKTVFLASGKHDVPGWPRKQRQMHDFIGFKMHLRLTPAEQVRLQETVEIFLFDDGYVGLEPVEDGKANLCLLIRKEIYTGVCGKNWHALLAWLSNSSTHLKMRLAGAVSLWPHPLAVYGTPYGFLHRAVSTGPDLFRLGDQMAVIPSFAGDGIAIALHSAFLATRTCLAGLNANVYHQQARSDFRRPVRIARIVTGLALSTEGRKAAFLLSRLIPGLMSMTIQGMRLAGKNILFKENLLSSL